jgi:uncharacterized protein YicC (UPF0701 family)
MFQTIISTAAGLISVVSVLVFGSSTTTHTTVHQQLSTTNAHQATPSATPAVAPTPDRAEIEQQIQNQITASTESAKQQMDVARQQAIAQTAKQLDDAKSQIDASMSQMHQAFPGQSSTSMDAQMNAMKNNLEQQKQDMTDQFNKTMVWK